MKTRGFGLLIVFVLAISGCGSDDVRAQFTDQDSRIDVAVGDEFQIVLDSNVTTGFGWDFEAPLDTGVLELVDEQYEAPDTDRVGAGGQQVFDFRAVGDGSTFIQLWYIRPFDDPPEPADHAQFEVIAGTGVPDQTVDPADIDEPVDPAPDDENAITLAELIAGGDATDVTVRTVLFDDGTGLVMCGALAESFPPQCPGDRVPIANPEAVQAVFTRQGEISWTDTVVVLTGTMNNGTFTVS